MLNKQNSHPTYKPLVLKIIIPKPQVTKIMKLAVNSIEQDSQLPIQYSNIKVDLESTSDSSEVRSIRSPEAELVPVFNKIFSG